MVTYLSRLSRLGLAKETTQGTAVVPTDSIAFTKAQFDDVIEPLRDESIRANDSVLQGLYQGVWTSTFDIETHAYPDITGHWLRALIGPDTVVAGVSTTLSASTTAGATSITTAASIPALSTIVLTDTGGTNIEYATTGTPTGAGPYTIPITSAPLLYAHTSPTCTVVAQSTHTFAAVRTFSTVWPSYTLTLDDGTEVRAFPGQTFSELAIKIDPKGIVSMSPKCMGWPSVTASTFTPSFSAAQPLIGWQWTITNAGGASTRGLSLDITLKRATEAIHSSDGTQGPREIFAGSLECDGSYKAIFENTTDLNLYRNATQSPTVATLTQPVGGANNAGTVLILTMSQSSYPKGTVDLGQTYIEASFDLSGIHNSTDGGVVKAVLKNYRSSVY